MLDYSVREPTVKKVIMILLKQIDNLLTSSMERHLLKDNTWKHVYAGVLTKEKKEM